jgi:hypothetical protein
MNECLLCSRFRYSILSALQSYGLIFNADKLLLGLVAITGNNLSYSGFTRASDFLTQCTSFLHPAPFINTYESTHGALSKQSN